METNMPKQDVERSLGEEVPETTTEVVNTPVPTPTPEDFDVAAWLAGVRPVRRSVLIRPNGHLVAKLEELAARIQNAPDDANVDSFIDEFDQAKAQLDDGVWFTLEKRSVDWVRDFHKATREELGLPDGAGGLEVVLRQLVEQIVSPVGVTVENLRQLVDQQDEVAKLILAMTNANKETVEDSQVLTLDFSQRRSTTSQGSSDS